MKGYKSESQDKITQNYPTCQVSPPGGMSKNDEKTMIFDDFAKIHYFQELNFTAELVKLVWDSFLVLSYLLL